MERLLNGIDKETLRYRLNGFLVDGGQVKATSTARLVIKACRDPKIMVSVSRTSLRVHVAIFESDLSMSHVVGVERITKCVNFWSSVCNGAGLIERRLELCQALQKRRAAP